MKDHNTLTGILLVASVACVLAGCSQRTELRWHEGEGYRWAELATGTHESAGFRLLDPSDTGLRFENRLTDKEIESNQHLMNGSGVAAGDVDGDGWVDLYFARLNGSNRLFKNLGGFDFRDVTDSAGVGHDTYYSTGAVLADVDGDGDLDLLVTALTKENALYLNDGYGQFSRAEDIDLGRGRGSHTMALADIDLDADLDLYITNYKAKPVEDIFPNRDLSWEGTVRETRGSGRENYTLVPPFDEHYTIIRNRDGRPERRETGEADVLYLNPGNGAFERVRDPGRTFLGSNGISQGLGRDWGLTAKFQDINLDGLPDLYVCNDFWTPDRVWINQGGGIFRAIDPLAIRSASFSSMTVDFSDIDKDGALDFFTTEMLSPSHEERLRQFIPNDPFPADSIENLPKYTRNSLYLNRGDDTFAEISYFSGLEATGWSWATRFIDVDLDGYEDLLVFTGFSHDVQDIDSQRKMGMRLLRTQSNEQFITEYPTLHLQNKAFRNDGNLRFTEKSAAWGFTEKDISHGLATADFDHDGDLDLAVNRLNEPAAVYENITSAPRVAVRLLGRSPNTQAVGAKVVFRGGPRFQQDEVTSGGDYLSGSDPLLVFAADAGNPNHALTVTWPDGNQTIIDSVRANRIYELREPEPASASPSPDDSRAKHAANRLTAARFSASGTDNAVVFEDVSAKLAHRHYESPYDDFRVQPLLPIKLSQQGPGVSWVDVDADGDDDLLIGSGRGGRLAVFLNEGDGNFASRSFGSLTETTSADQTAIVGWPADQGAIVLVGSANYEPGKIDAPSVRSFRLEDGQISEHGNVPGILSTTGPLAAADYDGDGDLDIFVGGRFVPAQYPTDATSRLFKNENGRFVLDASNSEMLKSLGMVTSAVFTDYDLDGQADLLLSLEWGTLKLYRNENGRFRDVSTQVGLHQHAGWWNGVTTGDFNNDGRPDIVATNWGLNSPYQIRSPHPLKMYYGDMNRDRRVEIIETYYHPQLSAYVPSRQLNALESASISHLLQANTHEQFARESLHEILGYDPERGLASKQINTLVHMLFVNEGDRFAAYPLPDKAQFSAAFHAGVADFDNDGNEDLFLSQNFFAVRPAIPRLDAGRGVWLRGDGTGRFEVVPGHKSGIKVYGEQRGAGLSDFNHDGKVDLVVTQNGAETKLYENRTPKAGLRVRLEGPDTNPAGIGSSIRLIYGDGSKGPRRTIQAGSGYWSQHSTTQVMGLARAPRQIEVTWFDGHVDTVSASTVAHDVIIHPDAGTSSREP